MTKKLCTYKHDIGKMFTKVLHILVFFVLSVPDGDLLTMRAGQPRFFYITHTIVIVFEAKNS